MKKNLTTRLNLVSEPDSHDVARPDSARPENYDGPQTRSRELPVNLKRFAMTQYYSALRARYGFASSA